MRNDALYSQISNRREGAVGAGKTMVLEKFATHFNLLQSFQSVKIITRN